MPMGIQLSTAFAIEFPVSTLHGKNSPPLGESVRRGATIAENQTGGKNKPTDEANTHETTITC
jgi:hypothetical protein